MSAFPTVVVLFWVFSAFPAGLSPSPDEGERQEAAGAPNNGPFKSEFHRAVLHPSGAVAISGEPLRDWKDCLYNSVEGRLAGLYGATVVITVDRDDRVFPLAGLCDEDREYVRSRLEAHGKENLFPGAADPNDEAAKLRLTAAEWQIQLGQWAGAGGSGDPKAAEEAWNHLRNVRDPNAMRALSALVTRGKNTAVRTACVESVAAFGGDRATRFLVKLAATDRNFPIRASATWALCHLEDPQVALAEYARYLRSKQFREPALLSLQATGLVRPLNTDEAANHQLIDALIGILIVKEELHVPYRVQVGYDTGPIPKATGGYHRHGGSIRYTVWARFKIPIPYELARRMLVQHSGEDHGYDRQEWRKWLAANGTAAEAQPPDDAERE